MIPFNIPPLLGGEIKYIKKALQNKKLSGDDFYSKKCQEWLEEELKCKKVLLTPSCTAALELASLLCEINPGDEVIMPSFTFSSTANAFALRGAKIVFTDIRSDTMNIDENIIEKAITAKTKAIVVVHYGGVACEMKKILAIAGKHHLLVIEDAAQGLMGTYCGKPLGTIGDIGCLSFHATKNIVCGEGGAIILNNQKYISRAEIIREKGTNRSKFLRGEVDKYSWVDIGSSYLLGELDAAFLLSQLENCKKITEKRLKLWKYYYQHLSELEKQGILQLPRIPDEAKHNGHIFFIKVNNLNQRLKLAAYLKKKDIITSSHYVPLHSSKAGKKFGRFFGKDRYTTTESERILRLPLYYSLSEEQIKEVTDSIINFFKINE
jgi:dTDP-4-amino-4,6-dideoxygalactose transaminase